MTKKKKGPKILLLDIETAPNLAWVWGKYEQDVIEYDSEWYILCYGAKWLGEKCYVRALNDFSGYSSDKQNDKKLVQELWDLLNEADIVVAHNGDQFDIKKMNTRFAYHRLPPPAPYKTIDTKKTATRYFGFNSNKLNDLGVHLGLGKKEETGGFKLWMGCMNGDKKAWSKMKKYNKKDVELLELIYCKFLPWMSSHPNVGMYKGVIVCPKCGSDNIQSRGQAVSQTTRYKRFQCQDCGGWGRARISERQDRSAIVSL